MPVCASAQVLCRRLTLCQPPRCFSALLLPPPRSPLSVQKALRKVDKARARSKRAKREKKNKTREAKVKSAALLEPGAGDGAAHAPPSSEAGATVTSSSNPHAKSGKAKKAKPKPRAAIVYLCCKGHHDVLNLQASLRLLRRHFLARFPYPVLILHDGHIQQEHKAAILNASRPASAFADGAREEGEGEGSEKVVEVGFLPVNISAPVGRLGAVPRSLKCRWHYQGYCEMSRFFAGALHDLPQVPRVQLPLLAPAGAAACPSALPASWGLGAAAARLRSHPSAARVMC